MLKITEMLLLVELSPFVSTATALKECVPLDAFVVSQDMLYEGPGPVRGLPRFAPSSLNCTLATPTDDVAFADIVTFPVTAAPFEGDVIVTEGGGSVKLGDMTVN